MSKRRTETWLLLIAVGIALIPVALAGLWGYMTVSATPLHPDPKDVRSVTHSAPLPQWAGAVEQGRRIVRAGLTEQNLPGLSVAVGVDGDVVWAEGFGWGDLENRVPIAPDLKFRIGTASTALTSAAVGLLLEEGRLKPDEVIQTYVPAFPHKQWPVTLRHLMGHLAGVGNDGGDEGPLLSMRCERPVDALAPFADRPLLFEPGTQYRYSS
jgi:serine beta-lactamase-like protein LACTB